MMVISGGVQRQQSAGKRGNTNSSGNGRMGGTIELMVWNVLHRAGGAPMYVLQRELPFVPESLRDAVRRLCRSGHAQVGKAERKGRQWVNVYYASDQPPVDRRGLRRAG